MRKLWKLLCMAAIASGCPSIKAESDIGKLDPNMVIPVVKQDGIAWHTVDGKVFRVAGFPWFEQDRVFRRLPLNPSLEIPPAVNSLANDTAGGQVSFRTDSGRILIRVKLKQVRNMYHMAPTGHSGFDLYVGEGKNKKFFAVSKFNNGNIKYETELRSGKIGKMQEYTLNFPLYNGVEELLIGVAEGAAVQPPSPFAASGKIVIYGGSSVQGACASRPGRCHMNIISRKLDMEVVNLGFSGNGKMEPEMAGVIAGIADPAVFIIEAERNTGYEKMTERLENFINILKQAHPQTPVVIMSACPHNTEIFGLRKEDREKFLEFMRNLTEKMKPQGVYLFDSSGLHGDDFYECTVDGVHPTDLGFCRMAEGLTPFLSQILQSHNNKTKTQSY